jgi:16S rRNA (cytosine967-C5)-methyltransferase
VALKILVGWLEAGGDPKKELRRVNGLSAQDRSLVWELVVGTIKKKGRLERFLPLLLQKENPPLTLKAILLLSLFQLEEKKWPEYAVVNEAVDLAKTFRLGKLSGVVNGCLRKFLRERPQLQFSDGADELAGTYSYPPWIVEEWLGLFGREKTIQMLAWGNGAPALFVRINRLKTDEGEFFSFLSKQNFEWERSQRFLNFYKVKKEIALDDFELLREGKGYIQDPSTTLAVRALDPHPNEEILDACAAPGGKTALIAESGAKITAVEKSVRRAAIMAANFKRLGVKGVHLITGDFLTHSFKHTFDKILIDTPCTGLGTIARHPELRWEKKKEDALRLGAQALQFLERGAGLVKAGGVIVYSTCTLTAEENWDACEKFLAGHPDFEREHAEPWTGGAFCDKQGNIVILPGEYETDGVFVCRFLRKN